MGVGFGFWGVLINCGERFMWLDFVDGGGSDFGGVGSEFGVFVGIGGVFVFCFVVGVW